MKMSIKNEIKKKILKSDIKKLDTFLQLLNSRKKKNET